MHTANWSQKNHFAESVSKISVEASGFLFLGPLRRGGKSQKPLEPGPQGYVESLSWVSRSTQGKAAATVVPRLGPHRQHSPTPRVF